jgi:hypothetical protein
MACGHRALCEADAAPAGASRQCHQAGIACASGKVFPYWNPLAAGLRKPATGSFVAVMGGVSRRPSSFCKKKQKPRTEKGECDWQYTIWKRKS